jgi:hypothetical protein
MINEPGHPTGRRAIPEETPMLKTISAALLAISVLAAPAMAAGIAKTTPVSKTTAAAPVAKTAQAPAINAVKAKPSVMNSNAKMGRHHHRFHRHHRFHKRFHKPLHRHFHKHVGANKPHQFSKVTVKHVKTAIKRG